MALNQSALIELLKELELTDTTERIRLLTQRAFQELINAEAETVIGAAPYERSEGRTTQRNGTRPRTLSTTAGDLDLRIPKLREGSFFPSLLERRRRVDQALLAGTYPLILDTHDPVTSWRSENNQDANEHLHRRVPPPRGRTLRIHTRHHVSGHRE